MLDGEVVWLAGGVENGHRSFTLRRERTTDTGMLEDASGRCRQLKANVRCRSGEKEQKGTWIKGTRSRWLAYCFPSLFCVCFVVVFLLILLWVAGAEVSRAATRDCCLPLLLPVRFLRLSRDGKDPGSLSAWTGRQRDET